MAKSKAADSDLPERKIVKLPKLPKNARVTKRPLLHPPIPSPRAGAHLQKVVYISAKTPFVSAIKRVRKLLTEIDKRSMGAIDLSDKNLSDKERLEMMGRVSSKDKDGRGEEVSIKGTGRAIEKALQVGLYFMGQKDCSVQVRTGSVGTVDDISIEETADTGDGEEDEEEDEDVPEARMRWASTVEILVCLK